LGKLQLASFKFEQSGRILFKFEQLETASFQFE